MTIFELVILAIIGFLLGWILADNVIYWYKVWSNKDKAKDQKG